MSAMRRWTGERKSKCPTYRASGPSQNSESASYVCRDKRRDLPEDYAVPYLTICLPSKEMLCYSSTWRIRRRRRRADRISMATLARDLSMSLQMVSVHDTAPPRCPSSTITRTRTRRLHIRTRIATEARQLRDERPWDGETMSAGSVTAEDTAISEEQ